MLDVNSFSRRDFLKGATALGITSMAIATGACESCYNKIKERPTRRNIANLAANDPIIQTYKDAVNAMKNLPAGDGRNWTKQAEIHLNKCVHGNWWFLPWHRAYLFYFEAICRKLTGNNDFALPYWNWTTSTSIPAPFWGAGNPLLNPTRTATQASVVNSSICGASNINSILGQTNFLLFASAQATAQNQNNGYGVLEGSPHNYVHGFVGGEMATYMSPLDSVFWCHHNMIECLAGATSIDDPHYAGSFAFFCCPDPAHAGMAVAPTPKLRYLVDVTQTVRRLGQGGSLSPDLDVTLVPVPVEEQRRIETPSVTLGRVELAVASF